MKSRRKAARHVALRRRAVALLPAATIPPNLTDARTLVHELQVHQIELELQNLELRQIRDEIEAERARYAEFYDFTPVGYFSFDTDGKILRTNLTGAHLLATPRSQLTGHNFAGYIAPQSRPAFLALLARAFAGHTDAACDLTLSTHTKAPRTVLIETSLSESGDECRAVLVDVTERRQTLDRLQLAAGVFASTREGIMVTDINGVIVDVNDAFSSITGYCRDEAVGQNPRMLQSGRHGTAFYAAMWSALTSKGHWYGEIWNRRKDGRVYAEMLTINVLRDAAGQIQHYVGLFTDITEMKEHQRQLEHIAHFDGLTNLPNRVLLADRLQQAMVQSQRHSHSLAVAYLDLDGFKAVNDTHGHAVGDELLIALAQRMKSALREGDTLARIGGDEFIAVLVDLEHPEDSKPVLSRLLKATADPVKMGSAVMQLSASIGVTLYPQDGVDADQLIRHADQAKQAGKNRYHLFDIDQDAAVGALRQTLDAINGALDRGEFVLHYQPKVNMITGEVIGAEALIRWQHPERGLLAPGAFLPLIEGQPISVELGEWVIDAALAQLSAWHGAELHIPVSVNIDVHQLQQPDFTMRLRALLADHADVDPGLLQLEVLETSALADLTHCADILSACRELGVSFALDDFGTGYSSLTYLKRLPVGLLKIDQSFVHDMLDDPDDLAIVEGVIGLAQAFRCDVIAEGVETPAQGALLLPLGCTLAQGYGIAPPMPAQDLPEWIKTWRPETSWAAWRWRTPDRDDLAIAFAEVEHRHWLRMIEVFLAGDNSLPPPRDARRSQFSRWQEGDGHRRYSDRPQFSEVVDLHDRLHTLGKTLVDLHVQGCSDIARSRLPELHHLRDELMGKLHEIVLVAT